MKTKHFSKIGILALPTSYSLLLTFLVEIINTYFISLFDTKSALAGFGFAIMMVDGLWVAYYLGMNGVLDIEVAQAYG